MGKHANKKARGRSVLAQLAELTHNETDREQVRETFQVFLENDFTPNRGHWPMKQSPRLIFEQLVLGQTPADRQLLQLFVDALLGFDHPALEQRVSLLIEEVFQAIKNLNRSSTLQRQRLSECKEKLLRHRRLLSDILRHQDRFSSRVSKVLLHLNRIDLRIRDIDHAERYRFPDTVSELRNGKGNLGFSIARPSLFATKPRKS